MGPRNFSGILSRVGCSTWSGCQLHCGQTAALTSQSRSWGLRVRRCRPSRGARERQGSERSGSHGMRQRSPPHSCPRGRSSLRASQNNPRPMAKKARLPPSTPCGEQMQDLASMLRPALGLHPWTKCSRDRDRSQCCPQS